MPIVGTAGHVDHGKSTLVAALTGRDPDRWAAEKDRGLTIDLGFAWMTAGGHDISFVDVPGHERFLKNMLAGIEAIDVALLVVAADEGWAAQSEEHLAVLDLLDVGSGVVALTKTDRVDDDLSELAQLEITDRLSGTSLAGSPIVPVSAVTGAGLPELVDALVGRIDALRPTSDAAPTLWVDRTFSVAGSGTVVTGSLLDGPVRVGDSLELQPGGRVSRVRSLQSHEATLEVVGPGRRVAMGLPDINREAATRGTVLTPPGTRGLTTMLLAAVRLARGLPPDALSRGAFHLHLGSGATPARLRPIGSSAVVMTLDTPVPAIAGDRFILRDVGRRQVVAGGRVLDPAPDPRSKSARTAAPLLATALDHGPDAVADVLLALRGATSPVALRAWTGGGTAGSGVLAGSRILHPDRVTALVSRATEATRKYHAAFPLRPGVPKAQLASTLGVDPEVVDHVVTIAADLEADGATVRAHAFTPRLGPEAMAAWEVARAEIESAGLSPRRAGELIPDEEILHHLLRSGELISVGEFAYLPAALEAMKVALAAMPQPFTVSEAREHLGVSRKHAVPLMEWCDGVGFTRRNGSERRVRG